MVAVLSFERERERERAGYALPQFSLGERDTSIFLSLHPRNFL